MTQRDVVGREGEGGSCLGTHVRIKDFKIKKKEKQTIISFIKIKGYYKTGKHKCKMTNSKGCDQEIHKRKNTSDKCQ